MQQVWKVKLQKCKRSLIGVLQRIAVFFVACRFAETGNEFVLHLYVPSLV